jgi:hypothetical protein
MGAFVGAIIPIRIGVPDADAVADPELPADLVAFPEPLEEQPATARTRTVAATIAAAFLSKRIDRTLLPAFAQRATPSVACIG